MKKIVALLLAFAMLATLSLFAFAADEQIIDKDNPDDKTAQVIVDEDSLDAAEWWSVQIPAAVTEIAWGTDEVDMSYGVASQLKEGKTLSVAVSAESYTAEDGYALVSESGERIEYTPTGFTKMTTATGVNGSKAEDGTITYVDTEVKLAIASDDWNAASIAVYDDLLTYTVTVNPAQ